MRTSDSEKENIRQWWLMTCYEVGMNGIVFVIELDVILVYVMIRLSQSFIYLQGFSDQGEDFLLLFVEKGNFLLQH